MQTFPVPCSLYTEGRIRERGASINDGMEIIYGVLTVKFPKQKEFRANWAERLLSSTGVYLVRAKADRLEDAYNREGRITEVHMHTKLNAAVAVQLGPICSQQIDPALRQNRLATS
ncbi:uncharacterized protein CIMG_05914 [Coccidioides immitis RS]|uniref:Uncharacterized protein n=4 Tax=Coccidioides immitis TaxID=5501 RepID=A0A0E1RVQ2_COCIM|nr:uncharacterized protein CIMG_05914 [Coccidioides immitis RS]EAS30435.2 hypothetical protein CIMG_05914 [Coccidioides immitis RS]KMP02982.1 hypothetical protein CIRG_02675 [Coccidioides immitis RMSCC 2394]KMU77428.1 hypothetical protein CISG_06675 [Coccidioides immitis RMSCC 3703]KMU90768.1 hypothetical protein CIHG_08730 [Coccidioides immitis H538.4]